MRISFTLERLKDLKLGTASMALTIVGMTKVRVTFSFWISSRVFTGSKRLTITCFPPLASR